ncbi:ribosomal rna large subunit methyltransferase j [Podospora aff. communis PSN243]|uniref:rRNA methyltransferase 2, mitochondrial n=1 Tax=Podospora aff. communis PSN243 TaxID=3040156 RepID=A0AAV9GHE6_9PEZI|nr:ribosomal rna large subunit methyltransferase j [Podospora aff. communis PSN243]
MPSPRGALSPSLRQTLTLSSCTSRPQHHLSPFLSFPKPPPPSPLYQLPSRPSSSNSRWKARQSSDVFARTAKVQGLKSRAAFKLLEIDSRYHIFKPRQTVVDLGYAPGSWSQVAVERIKPHGRIVGIDLIPAQPPKGVSTIQGNFLSRGVQDVVKRFLVEGRGKHEAKALEEETDSQGEEERPSYIEMERQAAKEEEAAEGVVAEGDGKGKDMRLVDVVLSDMSEPWPQTHGFSVNSLSNPYRRMMNTSGIPFKDHAGSMDLCRAALSFASDTLKTGGHFVCKFYQGAEDKAFENLLKKMFAKVHREKPESSRSESREAFFVALRRKANVTLEDAESK